MTRRDEHIHEFLLTLERALDDRRNGAVAQIWHEKTCILRTTAAADAICDCCPALMIRWEDGTRLVLNHDSTLHEFRHAA